MNRPQTPDSDEVIVHGDDAVIGRALRISLAGMVVLGGTAGLAWWLWPRPAPPPQREAATVTGPAEAVPNRSSADRAVPFAEVAAASGVDFVRTDGADGRKLLPETMGGGVAVADFNGDGTLDVALADGDAWPDAPAGTPRGQGVALYLNDGRMRFTRAAEPALAVPGPLMGLTAADLDGDGRTDLLATGVGGVRLYRNAGSELGSPRFEDITDASGLGVDRGWSTSAGAADVDRDGDLDLVVLHYVEWSPELDAKVDYRLAGVGRAYGPPTGFPGAQLRLYEQVSPLRFEDRTQARGLEVLTQGTQVPVGKALGLAVDDVDGDGDLDLLVANDTVRKFLFVNDGQGRFAENGIAAGFAFDRVGSATGAMGIDTGDLRRDGSTFVGIGNFANQPSGLYCTPKGALRFSDDAIVEGISAATRPFLTFGLLFVDLDLDGRLDFVQANGHIEDQIARAQENQSYPQRTQVFLNTGRTEGPVLAEVPPAATGDLSRPLIGRGMAWGDLDGDGDLDLVVSQARGPAAVFRNDAPRAATQSWIGIALEQPGSANRQAIGAVVTAPGPDGTQRQVIMPVRSYLSSVPAEAWFAVPAGDQPAEVTVTWPDGQQEKHSVLRGKRSTLVRTK
jgi:enediyne biosynthesis protein E4